MFKELNKVNHYSRHYRSLYLTLIPNGKKKKKTLPNYIQIREKIAPEILDFETEVS